MSNNNEVVKSSGRPKDISLDNIVFRDDKDVINFLVDMEAKLCVRLCNNALKTNNIKNNNLKIVKAKNEQVNLALQSIKNLKRTLEIKYVIDKKADTDLLIDSEVEALNNSIPEDKDNNKEAIKGLGVNLELLKGLL